MEDKKTRQRHCKEMVQLSAQFTSPRAGEEKRTVYLLMIAFLFCSFLSWYSVTEAQKINQENIIRAILPVDFTEHQIHSSYS